MGKFKSYVLALILLVLLGALTLYLVIPGKDAFEEYRIIRVAATDKKEAVFIRQKIWGLTSDHRIVYITASKEDKKDPDGKTDYIFNGFSSVFYKQEKDTIFIFCSVPSDIPPNWNSPYHVVQVKLNNPDEMDLLDKENYKKKALILVN
ncbi:hypothetical protein [Chitinophaga flava]|uniref:Uncharacterized protein n=1 Tax=Chitinophaga flava TaxID=2259036 RepID=A0A365XP94_9BACT|nr:hypothetical protein [Chitinophaga flava]RBL88137.1 hypothetical protein DF182_31960 [Chitinophaga flava]